MKPFNIESPAEKPGKSDDSSLERAMNYFRGVFLVSMSEALICLCIWDDYPLYNVNFSLLRECALTGAVIAGVSFLCLLGLEFCSWITRGEILDDVVLEQDTGMSVSLSG